jgi:glycosyltransferase involved in cell wall biosynthesis
VSEIESYFGKKPVNWRVLEPGVAKLLESERFDWKQPDKEIVLFFIGERRQHKNVLRLISLCHEINKTIPCKLIIAGKNNDYHFKLTDYLNDQIEYLGPIDDHEKFKIMCRSSYVALISDYEGYGIPISEANALGVPALTTLGSVMSEICGISDCIINLNFSNSQISNLIIEHWRSGFLSRPQKLRRIRSWKEVQDQFIANLYDENYLNSHRL